MLPLFYLIANHQITNRLILSVALYSIATHTIATDRRSTLHIAVQSLIYQDDLAYQPDGRLAVDANAGMLATFQTGATPVWRIEESSRHRITC